jgi:hypothetical protein
MKSIPKYWFPCQTNLQNFGVTLETKCVFNLVGVSTTLRCCRLHVKNLNHISTTMKNWYNDPHLNCLQHKDLISIYWLKKL